MPFVRLHRISKHYGAQTILREASWGIEPGQHAGLIGSNGAGKTTVLKLIASLLAPDGGEVIRQSGCRIGYLTQDPTLDPERTVLDEAISGLTAIHDLERELREVEHALGQSQAAEEDARRLLARYGRLQEAYERAGGYAYRHRAEAVLFGLGFTEADLSLPTAVLSGGQKTRLGLARLLLSDADLLLLDEPESHLDMAATEWLERYLSECRGAILLVSHDRYFLDNTVTTIVELTGQTLHASPGNYSRYLVLKEERLKTQERLYEQQQGMIARTEEFIRRNIAGQKTKQAQGRRKMLERLERIERPHDTARAASLRFTTRTRSGDDVVTIDRASKRYGDRTLFTDLTLHVRREDRIGIIGPNGCGKTTLLRLILGREQPTSGTVRVGASVRVGYYDQERAGLSRERTVLAELWAVRPTMAEETIRAILGRFLFSGDDAFKKVGNLSGGEQGRLALARLIFAEPNVLILDEPTNHLDIPSRHALEQALQEYPGTLLVVSHDRYFLDRVARELLVFDDQGIARWDGDYSSYRAYRLAKAQEDGQRDEAHLAPPAPTPAVKPRQTDPAAAQLRKQRQAVDDLEAIIQTQEAQVRQLEQALNDERVYTDPVKVAEAGRAYTKATADLDDLYRKWEELTKAMEQM